jgi:hypothetical protein
MFAFVHSPHLRATCKPREPARFLTCNRTQFSRTEGRGRRAFPAGPVNLVPGRGAVKENRASSKALRLRRPCRRLQASVRETAGTAEGLKEPAGSIVEDPPRSSTRGARICPPRPV